MIVRMKGKYKITATSAARGTRVCADWFSNLILDTGLDRWGDIPSGESAWNHACQVGAGNSTPTEGQSALDSFVAATTTVSKTYSFGLAPHYIATSTYVYTFAEGEAAGNLSEVGIGCSTDGANTDGPLFSRALILDGDGDPTTITVLSDEELQVTYVLALVPDTNDVSGTVTIEDIEYAYLARPMTINSNICWQPMASNDTLVGVPTGSASNTNVWTGGIGTITGSPTGTQEVISGALTLLPYVSGTYTSTYLVSIEADEGNIGGIKSMRLPTPLGVWQIEFDPVVPKTDTLTFRFSYALTWARAT